MTIPDLASELGDTSADEDANDGLDAGLRLYHSALPALTDAGLISWAPGDESVTVADHSAYSNPTIRAIIADHSPGMDSIVRALSSERRRHALAILRDAGSSVKYRPLARVIAARERGVPPGSVSDDAVTDVLISLHHVHLPALEAAGLVAFDRESDSVDYHVHSAIVEGFFGTDANDPGVAITA